MDQLCSVVLFSCCVCVFVCRVPCSFFNFFFTKESVYVAIQVLATHRVWWSPGYYSTCDTSAVACKVSCSVLLWLLILFTQKFMLEMSWLLIYTLKKKPVCLYFIFRKQFESSVTCDNNTVASEYTAKKAFFYKASNWFSCFTVRGLLTLACFPFCHDKLHIFTPFSMAYMS